jgi:hypothetical protein
VVQLAAEHRNIKAGCFISVADRKRYVIEAVNMKRSVGIDVLIEVYRARFISIEGHSAHGVNLTSRG